MVSLYFTQNCNVPYNVPNPNPKVRYEVYPNPKVRYRYVNVVKKTNDLMLITHVFQRTYGTFHQTPLTG